jgi:hypothetical protein
MLAAETALSCGIAARTLESSLDARCDRQTDPESDP